MHNVLLVRRRFLLRDELCSARIRIDRPESRKSSFYWCQDALQMVITLARVLALNRIKEASDKQNRQRLVSCQKQGTDAREKEILYSHHTSKPHFLLKSRMTLIQFLEFLIGAKKRVGFSLDLYSLHFDTCNDFVGNEYSIRYIYIYMLSYHGHKLLTWYTSRPNILNVRLMDLHLDTCCRDVRKLRQRK